MKGCVRHHLWLPQEKGPCFLALMQPPKRSKAVHHHSSSPHPAATDSLSYIHHQLPLLHRNTTLSISPSTSRLLTRRLFLSYPSPALPNAALSSPDTPANTHTSQHHRFAHHVGRARPQPEQEEGQPEPVSSTIFIFGSAVAMAIVVPAAPHLPLSHRQQQY